MGREVGSDTGQPNGGDTELPDVCVVTHPLSAAGENATRTLLEILSTLTTGSLVTADLPDSSVVRDRHEVVEITREGAGESILVAAWRFLRNQIRMARIVADRDEEIVLFFGATAYLLPALAATLSGKTVVLEPRGDVPLTLRLAWERQLPDSLARLLAGSVWALERLNYHLADGIITYTPAMAAELSVDDFSEKLYPNGARYVDIEQFAMTTPLPEREFNVGFVGRLDEEKGIRNLARGVKQLSEEVTVRFVGDGPLREWLEVYLSEEIDEGRVVLTGWVSHDDVPTELNRIQLLLLPSQPTEGLPTTILESLACGTPVYASPVSGIPDIIREGKTGFFLESTDPETIATGIETALAADLETLGQQGRTLIEDQYSFEAAVARYESILRSLVA